MLIPIGTDRPRRRPTVITYWLIAICVAVFFVQALLLRLNPDLLERLDSQLVLQPRAFSLVGLFAYQFLHADLMHLLGNMLFLFIFGPPVEDRLRRAGFLAFYLIGGIAAGIVHMIFDPHPVIGASGAIAAVTGAFLVMFPLTHIRVLLMFFIIGLYSIPAWWFIAFAIAKDFIFQGFGGGNVAYMAHIGGYLYGITIPLGLLWARVLPHEPFDLFSIGRQAHRRRQFRELASSGRTPWLNEAPKDAPVAKSERPAPTPDAASLARTEVSRLAAEGEQTRAAKAYARLLEIDPDAVMPRDVQLRLTSQLYGLKEYQTAAIACERFLSRYPRDPEAGQIKLLTAIIHGRYLNDPLRAKELLRELEQSPLESAHRELARDLARELG